MKPKTVYLFVFDTLADWEYGYAVAGINNPQFQKNADRYQVVTVGATTDPIITAGGIRITPDESIDKVVTSDSAMLILPGGASWDEGKNGEARPPSKTASTGNTRFVDSAHDGPGAMHTGGNSEMHVSEAGDDVYVNEDMPF